MLFSKTNNTKNNLIIDIGSSSVNFFILSLNGGKKEINSMIKTRLPLQEDPDFKHIERHAIGAIKEMAEEIQKKFPEAKPDMITVVASAPWYFCESLPVKVSRKEAFTIDKKLIDKLMSDEMELFVTKAKKNFSDAGSDIEILDKEIMLSKVNGYPIKNPLGKISSDLEFFLYISATKKSFKDNVNDILRHHFGNIDINFVSEPLAIFRVLSQIADAQEGFVVVDVGGEVTEVYLIREGILQDVKNFNWGGNLVVRRLASSMKLSLSEALSFFNASAEGDLKVKMDEKISPSASGVCSEWQNFLSQSLTELGKSNPLPQELILIGGTAGSAVLASCANTANFASLTILGKPFNIMTLIPENFGEKISLKGIDSKDKEMTLPLLLALSTSYVGI